MTSVVLSTIINVDNKCRNSFSVLNDKSVLFPHKTFFIINVNTLYNENKASFAATDHNLNNSNV